MDYVWLILVCGLAISLVQAQIDPICRIVQRNGLDCEVHRVQTADGYQLTLQRIPPPRNRSCPALRPFVLMHGLIGSAGDFVSSGRDSGLAFRLNAHCFDVWLPNARGNTHSRRHYRLQTSQAEFWNFSWHEIGIYDLPAILQYVLAVTGQQQLHYVGHSQGSTVLLVLLSQQPAYNARFGHVVMLAPVAYVQHLSSPPLRLLASESRRVTLLLNQLGLHELLPATALTQLGGQYFCSATVPTYAICTFFTSLYVGFSDYPADRQIFTRVLETTPAGISRGQFKHYGQLIQSGGFQQFDYGTPSLNMQHYGQAKPPSYKLNNVRLNVQLFYGTRDVLATQPDVLHLVRDLVNSRISIYQIQGYNHVDFLYSSTAARSIYEPIIDTAYRLDMAAG